MKHLLARMLSLLLLASGTAWAADKALAVHLISGSKEYKSEPSLQALQKELEERYQVSITASWVQDGAKDLPGVEHVAQADLLLIFARRMKLPEEQMAVIRKHWESGKPIVGLRTSSHAFGNEDNAIFDRQVMAGNYTGHFGNEPVAVSTAEGATDHPVLKDVGEIVSLKMYKAGELGPNAMLLQNGTIEAKNATHAVTWTNTYKGGRMFYTSLGGPADFENEQFRRMIINAIFWTTKSKEADYLK
jgi:type 1 glutamine amidotransferase